MLPDARQVLVRVLHTPKGNETLYQYVLITHNIDRNIFSQVDSGFDQR